MPKERKFKSKEGNPDTSARTHVVNSNSTPYGRALDWKKAIIGTDSQYYTTNSKEPGTKIKRESTNEKVKVGGTRHQSFENYYHPDGKKAKQLKTKFETKAKQQKAMAKKNAKSYHQQMKRSSAPKSIAGRAMTGTKRKNVKTRKA